MDEIVKFIPASADAVPQEAFTYPRPRSTRVNPAGSGVPGSRP
jgi:hypothetical protein